MKKRRKKKRPLLLLQLLQVRRENSYFETIFFKERLGLKLTHKRITTKVVLPVSKGKGAIQGEVKMCKEGESYDVKLLMSPKVRRYRVRNQRK